LLASSAAPSYAARNVQYIVITPVPMLSRNYDYSLVCHSWLKSPTWCFPSLTILAWPWLTPTVNRSWTDLLRLPMYHLSVTFSCWNAFQKYLPTYLHNSLSLMVRDVLWFST
jgi:hypothetical protein